MGLVDRQPGSVDSKDQDILWVVVSIPFQKKEMDRIAKNLRRTKKIGPRANPGFADSTSAMGKPFRRPSRF